MFSLDDTIDAFRRGILEIDCRSIKIVQQKQKGKCFEGQGYIRQDNDGALKFKIYVDAHNADPFGYLKEIFSGSAGKIIPQDSYYAFEAIAHDGTCWAASRIIPQLSWGDADQMPLVEGKMQSMKANLDMPQRQHYLGLHFFEEYDVPSLHMSVIEDNGRTRYIRDRSEFEACGAKFEVKMREGSGDTIVEMTSDSEFSDSFDLRIREAFQFVIAKPAFFRAKVQSFNRELQLELSSPWQKITRTQLSPPIATNAVSLTEHSWRLFDAFLVYVNKKTTGARWNPVAYHLNNACEATANSIDARAVGVSVAVEAVAGLIALENKSEKTVELKNFQKAI